MTSELLNRIPAVFGLGKEDQERVVPTQWLDYNHPAVNTMSQDAVKIRALAVDDHPLLREGIAALIADETDIEQFRTLRPTSPGWTSRCRS